MFNLRGFDLNLLAVFEAIYEAGTVSRAAERLALSRAATSHALGRLRDLCGDELFVRAGAQFVPTPVAQMLYPNVQNALRLVRTGLAEAQGFDPTTSERQFNLTIPHPLAPLMMQRLRLSLAAVAPRIVLRTDTKTMPADLASDLREGRVDLAIDWMRGEHDRLVNTVIHSEELLLIARRDHPRIGSAPTLDQVLREEFVWLHPRGPLERRPEAARKFEGLGLRRVLYVSEWLEIPTLVSIFDLLSVVPKSLAPTLVGHLGVKAVPFPASIPHVPIFAVWHEGRRRDPAHQWLRKVVTEELRRGSDV
jgi:LysR family transcriptional regulator, transcriptional activator for leuABCD operon